MEYAPRDTVAAQEAPIQGAPDADAEGLNRIETECSLLAARVSTLALRQPTTETQEQIRADGTCNAPGGNRPSTCGSDCDPTCMYGSPS